MHSDLPNHAALIRSMVEAGHPTGAIGKQVGCTAETVRRYLVRNGMKAKRPCQIGAGNHCWRGGRRVDKSGYILVYMPDHPHASCGGCVREHRLVVEKRIGRYLTETEVVDHVNGVRDDNRSENLVLYACNADHLRATLTGKPHNVSPEGRARLSRSVILRAAARRLRKTDGVPLPQSIGLLPA